MSFDSSRASMIASAFVCAAIVASPAAGDDWTAYGGDVGGTRYSSLEQITRANVSKLRVAWTFRTGDLGKDTKDWQGSAFEATPIFYNGLLFFTSSNTDVFAIDASSGALKWKHESQSRKDLHYSDGVSRGVSIWIDEQGATNATCHARIFAPTLDGRLLALDASSGKLCDDFGNHGAVDLLENVRSQFHEGDEWRNYLVTSPPAIMDGKVIV